MELFKKILVITFPILLIINFALALNIVVAKEVYPIELIANRFGIIMDSSFRMPFVGHKELLTKFSEYGFFPNVKERLTVLKTLATVPFNVVTDGLSLLDIPTIISTFFIWFVELMHIPLDLFCDVINFLAFIVDVISADTYNVSYINLPI